MLQTYADKGQEMARSLIATPPDHGAIIYFLGAPMLALWLFMAFLSWRLFKKIRLKDLKTAGVQFIDKRYAIPVVAETGDAGNSDILRMGTAPYNTSAPSRGWALDKQKICLPWQTPYILLLVNLAVLATVASGLYLAIRHDSNPFIHMVTTAVLGGLVIGLPYAAFTAASRISKNQAVKSPAGQDPKSIEIFTIEQIAKDDEKSRILSNTLRQRRFIGGVFMLFSIVGLAVSLFKCFDYAMSTNVSIELQEVSKADPAKSIPAILRGRLVDASAADAGSIRVSYYSWEYPKPELKPGQKIQALVSKRDISAAKDNIHAYIKTDATSVAWILMEIAMVAFLLAAGFAAGAILPRRIRS